MPLAKAVQILKSCSSKWINDTKAVHDFAWQEGYGAFSVSASHTEEAIAYIANQVAHHLKRSYEEEFLELLKGYGIPYDPKYVMGYVGRPSGTCSRLHPTQRCRAGLTWSVPPGL
jgi:hypothetical protein